LRKRAGVESLIKTQILKRKWWWLRNWVYF
jgi:hypothetical protein